MSMMEQELMNRLGITYTGDVPKNLVADLNKEIDRLQRELQAWVGAFEAFLANSGLSEEEKAEWFPKIER